MKPGDVARGGEVPRAGKLLSPAGSPAATVPFVPLVRSLLKYPLDSPEFEDAAWCAGPAEIAFTREILKQELDKLAGRHAVIDHRRDELRALYPGIKKAD